MAAAPQSAACAYGCGVLRLKSLVPEVPARGGEKRSESVLDKTLCNEDQRKSGKILAIVGRAGCLVPLFVPHISTFAIRLILCAIHPILVASSDAS